MSGENDPFDNVPNPCDNIEVLWILEDGMSHWWSATVIEIDNYKKRSSVAEGLIKYDPGPGIETHSVYNVKFLRDHSIRHVKRGRSNKHSGIIEINTWRYKKSIIMDEDDPKDQEWTPSKNKADGDISDININEVHCTDNNETIKSVSEETSLVRRVEKLQHQISSSMEKSSCLELQLMEIKNGNNHCYLSQIVKNTKEQLRRALLQKLMATFKKPPFRTDATDKLQFNGTITAKITCPLRLFQCIVSAEENSNSSESSADEVEYLPSIFSIQTPSFSIPSLHIIFKNIKSACDWLEIRDFSDREQCLMKISSLLTNGVPMLRVTGTEVSTTTSEPSWYFIGSNAIGKNSTDNYSRQSIPANILRRPSSEYDMENNRFVQSISHVEDVVELPTLNTLSRFDNCFEVKWVRLPELVGRTWSIDATRNPDLQLGELHVSFPVFYLQGATAIEIDKTLTTDFTKRVLVSTSTSVPYVV